MVWSRTTRPFARRSRMMSRLASKTSLPLYSGTSEVNLPSASTGMTRSMPYFWQVSISSSPNAGAWWTIPVPSSVVT